MKYILAITTALALMALFALPALSEIKAISNPNGEMIIGDEVVLTIHAAAGGMSIQQRVDQVTTRLNKRLGDAKFDPKLITVSKVGSEYAVAYQGDLIATADSKTAEMNGTTTQKLAEKWAANLRRVIPLAKAKTRQHGL
jgi:hypothetical protein